MEPVPTMPAPERNVNETASQQHWETVAMRSKKPGLGQAARVTLSASEKPFKPPAKQKPYRNLAHNITNGHASANRFEQFRVRDNDQDVNAGLQERFSRQSPSTQQTGSSQGPSTALKLKPNLSIRKYERSFPAVDAPAWISRREIPTSKEINGTDKEVEVPTNMISGPWSSKEEYLQSHYELLREDAISTLRDAVDEIRNEPAITEARSQENAAIYEKVYIIGLTFATAGIAARITFSLKRAGKKILWEQSKRLVSGTMIALSPAKDMFQNICRVAVVAARPLAAVQQNPPEIEIYFGSYDEIEIDPQQEWVMVEARTGYFEAYRHTLRSLQKLAGEKFPLSDHIVSVQADVEAPLYVHQQPRKDLSAVFSSEGGSFLNVDILNNWPANGLPELDQSQLSALRRILTKKMAVVQGPPGTGKTHVSVIAVKLLLENMRPIDPPIILAAHTNHALDQLLRHIATFEPNFIRLGGRSADQDIIRPRTLFELKKATTQPDIVGGLQRPASLKQKALIKDLTLILDPLVDSREKRKEVIPTSLLLKHGIISEAQNNSLEKGAANWVSDREDKDVSYLIKWLGRELVPANRCTMPEDFGIEVEEVDLAFEQLKELEAESKTTDDEDYDTLKGPRVRFCEPNTGQRVHGVKENKVTQLLEKHDDLWDIPESYRGMIYKYFQKRVKDAIKEAFRAKAREYYEVAQNQKIGKWEVENVYLKDARVVGMTTTGLSKYRGLVQSANPRVVLVEEAAETLEAYVTAACFESLEHLILVGDHQQLRGQCSVPELEGYPYNLSVSLFERLILNKIEFSKLIRQRRMIPEIRRLLKPIYDQLEDHPSVLKREPVPGMGGINSFFFTHEWLDSHDSQMSKINHDEAAMIVQFFSYLVHNGMAPQSITVLTFYNGQRKAILSSLRRHPDLTGSNFKVVTVDSYQGEENEIVLLSLVRSNAMRNIGFLSNENRICVALSRAQRGFYIFGNGPMLCRVNMLWWNIVQAMANNPRRVGFYLPLTCKNHRTKTYVQDSDTISRLCGGCKAECKATLPCGHICQYTCHPFDHESVICHQPCTRPQACGHTCREECYLPCKCACSMVKFNPKPSYRSPSVSPPKQYNSRRPSPQRTEQETKAFRDFAQGGHVESDARLHAAAEAKVMLAQQRLVDDDLVNDVGGTIMLSSEVVKRPANQDGVTRTITRELFSLGNAVKRAKEKEGGKKTGAGELVEYDAGEVEKVVGEKETGSVEMKGAEAKEAAKAKTEASDVSEPDIEEDLIDFD